MAVARYGGDVNSFLAGRLLTRKTSLTWLLGVSRKQPLWVAWGVHDGAIALMLQIQLAFMNIRWSLEPTRQIVTFTFTVARFTSGLAA
jgi:hypothetical protein